MEQYGKILIIAMPAFLLLIIIEKVYGVWKKNDTVPLMDSVSSISSGITNAVKDVLGLSVTLISYDWMVSKIAIFPMPHHWLTYVVAFVVIDFYGYWNHRWSHQINFLWNKHAIHHSSEEFNLACALRQTVSSFVNLFTFLLIPAALIGVPAKVIAITLPIQLFLQFWYHTKHIGKLGFLEHILVTPSHHRVHHAINPEYINKNHSQIFIFWDKWFGTFQAERDDVPAVYGITRPAGTWNPIRINFQHLWLLIQDAWRAQSWKDKFTIWFKPTGWRPAGFDEKYPVAKIDDVYVFEKYGLNNRPVVVYWAIVQTLVTLLFITYLFNNVTSIGLPGIFAYGGFVFLTVYSYTELMDGKPFSVFWEFLRLAVAVAIMFYFDGWFGIEQIHPWGNAVILDYLIVSLLANLYVVAVVFNTKTAD